ncbi:ABC transporter permease [Leuconostoc lactis]|uniref:ABC transporter permease n=1 Tax=Leuconostoc lactis TaxID=1246 RepID=UPI003B28A89E
MQVRELFVSALRSLLSNKRRSILTMIGIVIGISSVITILSLGDGARLAMLKNLQANTNGQQTTEITFMPNSEEKVAGGFNDNDLSYVRSNENVVKAAIHTSDNGVISTTGTINGRNISPSVLLAKKAYRKSIIRGKSISKQDLSIDNHVALISRSIAKKGYQTVGNALNSAIEINGVSYTIIGAIDGENKNYDVVVPGIVFESSNNSVSANTLKLTFSKGTNVSKATNTIVDNLNKKGSQHTEGSYEFIDTAALLKGISAVIKGITYFIVAVASISLFIAGIGVMNMMYISVSERTQEIGIRMAVGASQTQILWQFLIEAILLTISGGMIGYLFGLGIAMGISSFLPFKASVSLSTFLLAFGTSTIVGLIFGILPAKTASNNNLIDILR